MGWRETANSCFAWIGEVSKRLFPVTDATVRRRGSLVVGEGTLGQGNSFGILGN